MTGALDVSRETEEMLAAFLESVRKWSPKINLVSRSSLSELPTRHLNDSIQLFTHLETHHYHWADLGSGGGFPGLIIAILAKQLRPDLCVSLVESDRRKATFLRMVAAEHGLNVTVFADRIETVPPLDADVVSARALAPLNVLLGYVARHLAPHGFALLLKGEGHPEEIATARKTWHFNVEQIASVTQDGAALLKIKDIRHA